MDKDEMKQTGDTKIQSPMLTLKERLKILDKVQDLPAMPTVVMNLLGKLDQDRVKFREVEELISLDPALVSYILQLTNSPLMGLRSEVLTISKAISVIGITNLRSLIVAYGVRCLYKSIDLPDVQQYLWEHAVTVAVLGKVISEKIYNVVHSQIYVFGLLHDIGKIVMLSENPMKFNKTLELGLEKNADGPEAEAELYGFSHIEAGYHILSKQHFPKEMKDIILFHHNPEFCPTDNQPAWIISFANRLSYQLEDFENKNLKWYLDKLNLNMRQLESIVIQGMEQQHHYLSLF